MFFTVSQGIREFCAAMVANQHDWVQGKYEFVNLKHRDIAVWTCNGLLFVKIGGNEGLTLAEKVCVLRAVKLATARKLTTPNVRGNRPPEREARRGPASAACGRSG